MPWIENQSFSQNESINIQSEINESTDKLQEISDFFEWKGYDIIDFQDAYDSFSDTQKKFIDQIYQEIQIQENNQDRTLLDNLLDLPFDEDTFVFFQGDMEIYIALDDANDKGEWGRDITEKWNQVKQLDEKITVTLTNKKNNSTKEAKELEKEEENITKSKIIFEDLYKNYNVFFKGRWLEKWTSIEEIKSFFENPENVEAFLNDVKKNNPEEFTNVYNQLVELNSLGYINIQWLSAVQEYIGWGTEKAKSFTDSQIIKYWLDTSEFRVSRMEWDVLIYGDQKIDFWVKPPVKYITSGEFELQSATLDFKVDKQTRKEIFILEKTIPKTQNKIWLIRDKITNADAFMREINSQPNFTEQTLDYLYKQYSKENKNPLKQEVLHAIDTCDNAPDDIWHSNALKKLLESDTDNKKVELNTQVTQTEELLVNQESTLARLKLKLSIQIDTFKKSVLEQDEKTREVLDFITSIGLNLIPQSIFNQLITELQTWALRIDGIKLDPQNLDLENGRFWESDNESGGTKWKENLVKFYNKMISGDTGEPLDFTKFIWILSWKEDPTIFKERLKKYGIINDLWEPLLSKIRNNISTPNKSEETTQDK